MISQPKVLICDEVVSALDVTVQAQILDLLAELKEKLGLTLFFISHDLSVVNIICEDVLVLNKGKEVESGKTGSVFKNPKQAYTKRLLDSVLRIN